MPLIETKGAASAQGFGEFAKTTAAVYIEDVFSTWLTTGAGSAITVVNGIDLAGKGGLVWNKTRNTTGSNTLFDTARGVNNGLISDSTSAQLTYSNWLPAFNSDGFTIGTTNNLTTSSTTGVSWTFRKAPKFFDVVTWTGDGNASKTISHSLGSVPGCIITKSSSGVNNWQTYHRSLGNTQAVQLNLTNAASTNTGFWNNTSPTATDFTVGTVENASGQTYVAYLFAHNAGGFGLTGTDNVISCGSFTTDGSGNATVNLGYEPQWLITKTSTTTSDWIMVDVMRGFNNTDDQFLLANTSSNEYANGFPRWVPTATGFTHNQANANQTYIYIAIRRGPMKTPTTGTSVFDPVLLVNGVTNLPPVNSTINAPDLAWSFARNAVYGYGSLPRDRLSSAGISFLDTSTTAAEVSYAGNTFGFTRLQKGIDGANAGSTFNQASPGTIYWMFGRAPGFFDLVCYTGTGSARTVNHNLGVAPELMIVKRRDGGTNSWLVYDSFNGATKRLVLNFDYASAATSDPWNDTAPTSSVFTVGISTSTNGSGSTYVAYLFATVSGVSKVGSYTGTGALQTINCGFTGGARFVLIKRTDSTGDWFVYDSTRGISSGNDPYLLLNSATAEVTGTNYVDTTSVGFQVTAAAPAGLNANGGSYIFLAVA